MRIRVDRERCEANAVCVRLAPGVFHLDENDQLAILVTDVPEEQVGAVREAVRRCPRLALEISAE